MTVRIKSRRSGDDRRRTRFSCTCGGEWRNQRDQEMHSCGVIRMERDVVRMTEEIGTQHAELVKLRRFFGALSPAVLKSKKDAESYSLLLSEAMGPGTPDVTHETVEVGFTVVCIEIRKKIANEIAEYQEGLEAWSTSANE